MKAEKRGGKSAKMLTVQCSICGMDMDCPESMIGLLISTGMPPEFLDELAEGMRGARRGEVMRMNKSGRIKTDDIHPLYPRHWFNAFVAHRHDSITFLRFIAAG